MSPTIAQEPTRSQAAAPVHASARTARYVARLDPHLEALPSNAARIAFLSRELVRWTALYEQFVNLVDKGLDPSPYDDGPDVHDYLQTIGEISARKGRLEDAQ